MAGDGAQSKEQKEEAELARRRPNGDFADYGGPAPSHTSPATMVMSVSGAPILK
jgi:hypothetical protein